MKKPKPDLLSEEVLRKYLDQSLSPAEMHAVERAMLDSPLEAEALEGWASVPAASPADLADLRARLRARTGAGRTRRLVAPMLRAAAAVALLLVAGWWLWPGAVPEQASQAVATGQVAAQSDSATLADLPSDEAQPDSSAVIALRQAEPIEAQRLAKPLAEKDAGRVDEIIAAEREPPLSAPVAAEERSRGELAEAKKGPDTLATGGGQAGGELANSAKPKVATTADGLEKSKKSADPLARREADKAKTDAEEKPTVGGYAAKQEDAKYDNRDNQAAAQQDARPEGDWPAFRQYVAQAAKPGGAKGTVGLEVSLSARGKVTGVAVARPLDAARDREAQQLVRRYAGWQPATQAGKPVASKLVVEVVF
jgi:hypothetical protein